MYGYWLRPPSARGVDHVHTCATCWDDVECAAEMLDCPRYLGVMTEAFRCGGCLAGTAAAVLQAGDLGRVAALTGGRS